MITLRKFVKTGLLFLAAPPALWLPRSARAQDFFGPNGKAYQHRPAASGGGGSPTAFITGGVSGSDDGYAGDIGAQSGYSFTPSQAMTVTDMGAYSWPGSFGTATVNLYDSTACALLKSTTVDLSAHDSAFHYTSLGGGTVALTSGHKYFIYLWAEVYKINATPTVSGGSINDGAYNGCGEQGFGAGHASVGPNFKFT